MAGGKIFLLHIFLAVCSYSCIMGFGSPNAGEKLEHFVGLFVDLDLFDVFRVFLQVAEFYAKIYICMQNILQSDTFYRKRKANILLLNKPAVKVKRENVIYISFSLPPFGKYPYLGGQLTPLYFQPRKYATTCSHFK